MELLPRVHVIETVANCALLVDDRLVLVDTGTDDGAGDVLGYLKRLRRNPTDISTIILTHTHPDHVGGLAALKERSGARVAAHTLEADYISRTKPYPGPPGSQRHRPVAIDDRLEDGQRYQELLVIHTPGHTPGSIALLDEERSLLVAGDALRTQGGIGPMDDRYNIDKHQHRASIRKLAQRDFAALIVGHGPPVRSNASHEIRELAKKLG